MRGELLLVAPGGMLGRAWSELLARESVAHRAVGRSELDLRDRASIDRHVREGTGLVINCGAWTDVDGAEAHEEEATLVNGTAVGWLAAACERVGATLVHYSTDYVFDGRASTPYPVDGAHDPVNAYGRSKAVGEKLLRATLADHLLLRTSWVYAPWGNNFVRTMARLGREKEELRVVDDQRGRPSSAEQLAHTSLALVRAGARGTLHATDAGECTWFELAREVVGRVNPACTVSPCTSAEFPRPAVRPSYSVLDLGPTEALVGPLSPWQERVADTLARLEA